MKKVLSIFCLLSALNLAIPAFAAPPPHAKGHKVVAGPGYHHPPHIKHHTKCYSRNAVVGGVLARRCCWNHPYKYCEIGYWNSPFYGTSFNIILP